ncbi:MAG: hypothetical protein UT54_C0067G0003 [Candidatus Daviesbacteria bacterium GW2011_GWB1_39_5]|uniref:Uncharacterized protein n=1 Tax=Candidatus Daviesbacteria bacterium GW2011_GWC2_40_12 TaxID=1618431 RepID=A0A0G0QQ89_9BACT|nr:MAG: hypothetical protein UT04_C0054G0005 [Candidatus Daviesbacteria bacterium GW2011_GWF2_38_7]KKR16339.1 MAG: hypothetical protein UT45_C0006G0014 [Candidatus Daviesbacteria bacterium GW2011_GWA2_39_33]KKR22475.1 MAG: hypothetical protein UT54_C0067G0003 [Candidatus Daviesbacteria bacterium GW2011_GWB1_39_5]KKR42288.1 MAG: hypothetical protein UT77_C0003G0083 [Candidatus Daviesbacteria bacterium GW2011_GWC2_40_12]OGE22027.1 MAG: hypothetical protein A2778_01800 [Candidatus Daviesbacteria b
MIWLNNDWKGVRIMADKQLVRQGEGRGKKKDVGQKIAEGIATLLERVLDTGLAVHGKLELRVDRLVLCSVDKGREVGLVPEKEALQKEQLSPAMLRENAQDQKIQAERLDELKEEIANLRSMLKHQQSSGVSYAQEIQPSKRKTTL